ncbi:putative carboxypeptidase D [Dioscorea sansibarensis]
MRAFMNRLKRSKEIVMICACFPFFSSETVNENWKDSPSSMLPIYHELIKHGLRI